ncbi:bifunctional diguanylate cyclase/phosphodiesterase [Leeia oryzae]|uniref:bifunctional diguanylate cyclase/phosphodiesterase n=1 Tax=Leeia oryzae TaxID=356662 RepID=UPI00035E1111|nr:EAL domain-containing protein [Leeia oryzae]
MQTYYQGSELQKAQMTTLWICLPALVIQIIVMNLPSFTLFNDRHSDLLSVHLLLEMFSVSVSILVATIAWHVLTNSESTHIANPIIFGFTVLAMSDMMHAITYAGMPGLMTDSSTPEAIFFWLVGRTFAALVLLAIALNLRLPGHKSLWLIAAILCGSFITWLGTYHLSAFPTLFVAGQGVTKFKAHYEIGLCTIYLVIAFWLFYKGKKQQRPLSLWLGTACFVMGVGELDFTTYLTPSDFLNTFGHIYKIVSYGLIYKALFISAVRAPFQLLKMSEDRLQQHQTNLLSILNKIPHGVIRLDPQLNCTYVNQVQAKRFGHAEAEIQGKPLSQFATAGDMANVKTYLAEAFTGNAGQLTGWFWTAQNIPKYSIVNFVPEFNEAGYVSSVLVFLTDQTEQEQAKQNLLSSLKETEDLKTALDAHAIVVKTDANGVITSVNDKFCDISKYTREELVGQTHRLINSGRHPKTFFKELWDTISSGTIWNGEICNRAKDGSLYWVQTTIVPYMGPDGKPLQYMAIRADITARKNAEEEIEHLAFYDYLTGLPNRRLMIERLAQALLDSEHTLCNGALLFMDLDNFKEVNDTLGHTQGDQLLKETANRLLAAVAEHDTAARIGGDEFVVILNHLDADMSVAQVQAREIAENIRLGLGVVVDLNGYQAVSPPSIGVVMFQGVEKTASELLKQADMALYRAKSAGKNQVCFFDPQLQAAINARASLLADLRQALPHQEFVLHYQPIMDAEKTVLGYEALIRWQQPQRGMVPPFHFIDLAEQTGLIIPIGQWVLETACQQLVEWQKDEQSAHWSIAVNVSAKQFGEADYPQQVLATLQRTGAKPENLRLELTESMLLEDVNEAIRKMIELRRHGIRFSLDDFGTGYSSLSYLKRLPFDYLKIDRSFVTDIFNDSNAAAVVRTIILLAVSLEMKVIAEGVETVEQYKVLDDYGCHGFQGYYFGRPGPLAVIPSPLEKV